MGKLITSCSFDGKVELYDKKEWAEYVEYKFVGSCRCGTSVHQVVSYRKELFPEGMDESLVWMRGNAAIRKNHKCANPLIMTPREFQMQVRSKLLPALPGAKVKKGHLIDLDIQANG
jgi:hypothetical protein